MRYGVQVLSFEFVERKLNPENRGWSHMRPTSPRLQPPVLREINRLVSLAKRQGQPDSYPGKRNAPRFVSDIQVEATTNPQDPSAAWVITLHNISSGGFSCWSRRKLDVREPIFIREFAEIGRPAWLSARICHCTASLRGYLIGAKFDPSVLFQDGGDVSTPSALPSSLRPIASIPAGSRSSAAVPAQDQPPPWASSVRK